MLKKWQAYYHHDDVHYFIKEGKYKLLQQGVLFLFGFFLSWFMANYTTAEFFGDYLLVFSFISISLVFSFPGIKDAITQSVARGYEASLLKGTYFSIRFSVLGSLFFIFTGAYYFLKNEMVLGITFLICALFFPLFYSLDNFVYFLEAKKNFRKELISMSIITAFKTIFIFGSVLLFKNNLIMLFVFFFLSHIAIYLFFFLKCKRMIKNRKQDRELIGYGWFATKLNGIALVAKYIDKILIGIFVNPTMLAVYTIGTIIPLKIIDVLRVSSSVFYPRFSDKETKMTKKKIIFVLLVSVAIFLCLLVFIPVAINLFFVKYASSISYGFLYSIVVIFVPINVLLGYYYKGVKQKRTLMVSQIAGYSVKLATVVPFLYFWGVYGIILAEIVSSFTTACLSVYYYFY